MRGRFFNAVAAAGIATTPAIAQDAGASADEASVARERPAVATPTNEPQSGVSESAFSILGSSDAAEVALTIATKPRITDSGLPLATLALKAPLAKSGVESPFLTEQGLSNKIAVEGALTWLIMERDETSFPQQFDLSEKYQANCRRHTEASEAYRALQGATPLELRQKQITLLESVCKRDVDLLSRSKGDLALHLTPEEAKQIEDFLHKRNGQNIYLINISASTGYKKYEYLSPADFAKQSVSKHPFAVSVGVGFNPGKDQPFFGVGYQYRRDHKEADKRVLCPVAAGATQIECKQAVFDLPSRDRDHTLFALVRTGNFFGAMKGKRYAPMLEIKAGYDFEDKAFGISVPLYLFLDKDKTFKGGVKASWQERAKDALPSNAEDRFKFSIFVVKSFDYFGF